MIRFFLKTPNDDKTTLKGIRAGGAAEDKSLRFLYQNKRVHEPIKRYILNKGGSPEDFKDLYQEAIIDFREQVIQNQYRGTTSIRSYLFTLCKNKWVNRLRRKKRFEEVMTVSPQMLSSNPEIQQDIVEIEAIVMGLMEDHLGEKCRKLLIFYLYDKMSMSDVSKKLGYADAQNVANKKVKCIKRLRGVLETRPHLSALLKSYFQINE